MTESEKITSFEPHKIRPVQTSGNIYVGREHIGKTAWVYFLVDGEGDGVSQDTISRRIREWKKNDIGSENDE